MKIIGSNLYRLGLSLLALLVLGLPAVVVYSQHSLFSARKVGAETLGSIATSGKKLVDLATNQTFIVRSNQYIHLKEAPAPSGCAGQKTTIITTFHPDYYDPADVRQQFAAMRKFGYNTVRLVFNNNEDTDYQNLSGTCKKDTDYQLTDCVSQTSVDNLADALNVAAENNLKVILSFVGGTPFRYYSSSPEPYSSANINFLKEEAIRDLGRFYFDLFTYLKDKIDFASLLAVEPYAEPLLLARTCDQPTYPFDRPGQVLSYPEFYVPKDKTYVVSDDLLAKVNGQSSDDLREIINFSFVNAFNYWRSRMKQVDPRLLVLYEQFPAYAVQKEPWRHLDDLVLVNPSLQADIFALQLYPADYLTAAAHPEDDLHSFFTFTPNFLPGLKNTQRPFLIIEYGLRRDDYRAQQAEQLLITWQTASCRYQPAGWNFFNWSASNFDYLTATENNFALAGALGPNLRPDPCSRVPKTYQTALGDPGMREPGARVMLKTEQVPGKRIMRAVKTTASAFHDQQTRPENVLDGDYSTAWNAGDTAPQWIEFDLGESYSISGLRLLIDQEPDGFTKHQIRIGNKPNPDNLVKEFNGQTHRLGWLTENFTPPLPAARYLRITTTESPSWVAWLEIEIYAVKKAGQPLRFDLPAGRFADCIDPPVNGVAPANRVQSADEGLRLYDPISSPYSCDPLAPVAVTPPPGDWCQPVPPDDQPYCQTPNTYASRKELHLAELCRTKNSSGQTWYHWEAAAWADKGIAPEVSHQWSALNGDGYYQGSYRGVWQGRFAQPDSAFFEVGWQQSPETVWSQRIQSAGITPWVILFSPMASIYRQILIERRPQTPSFVWQANLKITGEQLPQNPSYRFAFPEMTSCWRLDGSPCTAQCNASGEVNITRFFGFDINPSRVDACTADSIASCPPYHLLPDGRKVSKGAPDCGARPSDGKCYPYDAYYYWCGPESAGFSGWEKCTPFTPEQEIIQLSPHAEWEVYGLPAKKISQSDWIGFGGNFEFDMGALTDRLYFSGRPKQITWESIYVGTEILRSPGIFISWQSSHWNLLVPGGKLSSCSLGDLNCDGKINLADLLSWRQLQAAQDSGADVNDDKEINILDYLLILKRGLIL